MGRVSDAVDPVTHAPFQTWAFPYTQVSFRCTGTYIGVRLVNHWGYGRATLGAVVDGMQLRIPVPIDTEHDAVTLENGYPSRVEPTKPAEPANIPQTFFTQKSVHFRQAYKQTFDYQLIRPR